MRTFSGLRQTLSGAALMIAVGLWSAVAAAATIIVPDDFATIQAAVDAAGAVDEALVGALLVSLGVFGGS